MYQIKSQSASILLYNTILNSTSLLLLLILFKHLKPQLILLNIEI